MKSFNRISYALVLSTLILLLLAGCRLSPSINEDKLCNEKINEFFTALDQKDPEAIKATFSESTSFYADDIDGQIAKLISVYPSGKTEILTDLLFSSEGEIDGGKRKTTAYTHFPVLCGGEHFWFYIEYTYEDDFDGDNVGINRVFVYTLDEFCAFFHSEEVWPEDFGILVFSELELDAEIRHIEMWPYEFTTIEREINVADVEDFIKASKSWADFFAEFGEPNAEDVNPYYGVYFYEIIDTDGTVKYLELFVDDGEITSAKVCSEFEFVKAIYEDWE